MQIAIIGAGHIGITLAEKLISSSPDIRIDLFERTPAPFGLIRYGKLQDNTGTAPQLRLFGNITVGTDITAAELGEHYDAVISTPCLTTPTPPAATFGRSLNSATSLTPAGKGGITGATPPNPALIGRISYPPHAVFPCGCKRV